MKVALLLFLTCFLLPSPALCAGPELPPDAFLVARWIASQQYPNPHLPSYGALKIDPGPAVIANGVQYCRVSPYFANLAVLGLLRAKAPMCTQVADRWINWYFAHLNPEAAPDGVPYEHFYNPDGTGETTCAKPGDHSLCHYNDATDSAAATFFSVLWAARSAERSSGPFTFAGQKQRTEVLASVLLKLQQSDGLCWAKNDYRAKYLEDNCEVFAGLSDLANLERDIFDDSQQATLYRQAAEKVRQGIWKEFYDSHSQLFHIAKFQMPLRPNANLDQWYPDTQAQFWPILFGVLSPADPRARAIISTIDGHWNGQNKPDWAVDTESVNSGWIESGSALAALLAGDSARVKTYVQSVKHAKFPKPAGPLAFKPPFNVADAGWLLQILTQLPQ